jgi:hypothetical protein
VLVVVGVVSDKVTDKVNSFGVFREKVLSRKKESSFTRKVSQARKREREREKPTKHQNIVPRLSD